jgi:hypothetical protein
MDSDRRVSRRPPTGHRSTPAPAACGPEGSRPQCLHAAESVAAACAPPENHAGHDACEPADNRGGQNDPDERLARRAKYPAHLDFARVGDDESDQDHKQRYEYERPGVQARAASAASQPLASGFSWRRRRLTVLWVGAGHGITIAVAAPAKTSTAYGDRLCTGRARISAMAGECVCLASKPPRLFAPSSLSCAIWPGASGSPVGLACLNDERRSSSRAGITRRRGSARLILSGFTDRQSGA